MLEYRLEIVNRPASVDRLAETLANQDAFAVDLETAEWWNREREKIALAQFAFRAGAGVKVAILDPLAVDLAALRGPLESPSTIKVMHNAAFDAVKLHRHHRIVTTPIFDTMLAARWSGEKKYSLQAQAAAHLGVHLNKSAQRSDWTRRPLDLKQLDYAARDAAATLLLYEKQRARNLTGVYALGVRTDEKQPALPLEATARTPVAAAPPAEKLDAGARPNAAATDLAAAESAILGVVSELPGRYHPDQLAVSVGASRVGLTGWIVDRAVGRETELEEETARLAIERLCELKLVCLTERRLHPTARGEEIWSRLKS